MDPTALIGILMAVLIFVGSWLFLTRKQVVNQRNFESDTKIEKKSTQASQQIGGKSKKSDKSKGNKKESSNYPHPWSFTTLKGHTGRVLDIDFASDGKRFVSISEDGTVILWHTRDFGDREHHFSRNPLEFDRVNRVVFASDSKSLLVSMRRENRLGVYRIQKREDTGTYKVSRIDTVEFPHVHTQTITHIGIGSNGKFVFSACAEGKIVIYNLRGDILDRLEPRLGGYHEAKLSPDARFLIVSGFSPEAFVYEIKFTAKGEFVSAKKAFNLQGANSGIHASAFNQDSSRAITVSKDGFWRIYNTDIRYQQGEDAKEIAKGEWSDLRGAQSGQIHVEISPSGDSFAISIGSTVKLCTVGEDFEPMTEVHEEPLTQIRVSPNGKLVATSGDKFIRIFHNIPESYGEINRLEKSLTEKGTDAQKRRIQESIDEIRGNLRKILNQQG